MFFIALVFDLVTGQRVTKRIYDNDPYPESYTRFKINILSLGVIFDLLSVFAAYMIYRLVL